MEEEHGDGEALIRNEEVDNAAAPEAVLEAADFWSPSLVSAGIMFAALLEGVASCRSGLD